MALVFDRTLRQITVPEADGTTVTVQVAYDAVRTFEALSANMDLKFFVTADGKQPLSGVSQVGITFQFLERWLLGFAARAGPATVACVVSGGNLTADNTTTGAATSTDAGTTLTDTGATFVATSVQTGDVLRNVTDGSTATVTGVTSETGVAHTALTGGTDNDWDLLDVWEIDTTHPIFPTAFTHVSIAQDTAPVDIDLTGILGIVPDACHIATSYVDGSTTIRMVVWLDRDGVTITSGLVSATVTWFNPDDTQLFTVTDLSAGSNGTFEINQVQALTDDTAFYVVLAIVDATGTVTTRRGVATAST